MDPNAEQGIVFEGEELRPAQPAASASSMAHWLQGHSGGLIRDERQANYALIAIAGCAAALALFLMFSDGSSPKQASPQELQMYGKTP